MCGENARRPRSGRYIFFHNKHRPLAIVQATDNHHKIGAGMQQALRYAEMMVEAIAKGQNRILKRVKQLLNLCDALEARLQSAQEERGRLVVSVMPGEDTSGLGENYV